MALFGTSVRVTTTNSAPVGSATAQLVNGTEDTSYTVSATDLLKGFSDPNGDTLSVINLTVDHGTFTVANGVYTITPTHDYNGVVTLNYTVSDGKGGTHAATQHVTFTAVNDAPVGQAIAQLPEGAEDTAYTVHAADLLQGFHDVDTGDTLSVVNLHADHGTVTVNHDGSFTITPDLNYNGVVHLSYDVSDSQGATVSATQQFNLAAVNDAPVGQATAQLPEGTEDTAYTVHAADLLQGFSDVDTGDTLSVVNLQADHGTVTVNHDGSFTITPDADYNGVVHLTYDVSDSQGATVSATQQFNLAAVNDAPVVSGPALLPDALENQPAVTITAAQLLANATDVDSSVSVKDVSVDPSLGTLAPQGNGIYLFTPAANTSGDVSFNVTVTDGQLDVSTSAVLHLTAQPHVALDAPAVEAVAPVNQAATITLSDTTFDVGDVYQVQIGNDDPVSVSIDDNQQSISTVLPALADQLQRQYGSIFTVGLGQDGHTITLHAINAADSVAITAQGLNVQAGIADQSIPVVTTAGAAEVPAQAQSESVAFDTVFDLADHVEVSVNGRPYGVDIDDTTAYNGNTSLVATVLAQKINEDANVNGFVHASVNGNGELVVTATQAGTGFTLTASATNASTGVQGFAINPETVQPNVTHVPAVAQVETFNLGDAAYQPGDVVSVTLNGQNYSYTVHAGNDNSAISSALAALLPTDSVVATVGQQGELVLTAAQAGTPFEASAAVHNISFTANTAATDHSTSATANVSQISTVQLDAQYDVGDTVTMTVNGQNYSYTVADEAHTSGSSVAQALLAAAGNALQTHTENSGTQIVIEYWNNAGPNPDFPFPGDLLPVFVNVPDTNPDTISAAIAANTPPGYSYEGVWAPLGLSNPQTVTPSVTAAANGSTITLTDHDTAGSFTAGLSVTDHVYADNTAVVATVATAAAAGSAGVAQVSSVSFADAAVTAGEVYSLTVNDRTYSTTAVAGSTLLGVVNALRSQIANDVNAAVTVISSKATLYLTAKQAGEPLTITSADAPASHSVAISTLKEPVAAVAPVAQVDSITLSQTYDVGDVVHLVVGGATLASHTVTAADTDASIATALAVLVDNGNYTVSSNNGVITITATQANVAFSASTTVANASGTTNAPNAATAVTPTVEAHTATAQLDTLTFNPSYDAGDVVSVTVNGNTVNFTVLADHTAAADVAAGLANLLNGNADVSAAVDQAGNLLLTATHTNTAVAVSSAVTNVGITDNKVEDLHPVPNTTPLTAAAQVDKVTITDTHVDAGDTYTLNLSIGGNNPLKVVYEAQDGDTAASVALALRALATIELHGQNVAVGGSGADIVLTSTVAGTPLHTSLDIDNAPAGSDTAHALSAHSTDAELAHAQISTVTFITDAVTEVVPGDVLTVSLNGGNVVETVTVDAGETLAHAAGRLATLVNHDGVGATADANGVITITGADNATPFAVDETTGVTAATVSNIDLSDASVDITTAPVAATKQVDTITLNAGALDEGDQVTVTVAGTSYTVTVSHAHAGDMAAVLGDLVAAINDANTGSTLVTAAVQNGTLVLTENNAGAGSYVVASQVTNVSGTLVEVSGVQATQAQTGVTVAAQQNTITLGGGNFDSTDTLTVQIGNQTFTETGLAGLTAAQVATQLVNHINTNDLSEMTASQVNGVVTLTQKAADIRNGAVTVTANIDQETAHNNAATYAVTTSGAAATTAQAQIDNITFGNVAPVAGDVYSVTVNGHPYSVTATASSTLVSILTSLKSAMASDLLVSVIRSGNNLVLTAKAAGAEGFTAIGEHDSGGSFTPAVVTVYPGHDATEATQEVTTIHLGAAAYDTGDVVVAHIDGHTFTVSVTQPTAAADVATLLQATIGNTYVDSFAVNANGTDLVVTAVANNTALNVSAVAQNNTLHANTVDVSPLHTNVAQATAQVLDVAYTGTAKAGDVVTVNVGGHDYSYTVASGDAEAQVYAGLATAIGNAGGAIGSASYDADHNQLVLTGPSDGSSFTATLSTTVAVVSDGTATADTTTDNIPTGTAEVVELSNLSAYTPDIGDVVSFVFKDSKSAQHTVSYTVHAADIGADAATTLTNIETGLEAAFKALDSGVSLVVSNGTLTFTGNEQGDAFTVDAPTVTQQDAGISGAATSQTTANLAADTHQVVDVTLSGNVAAGGFAEAGDTYSITLTPAQGDPVVISYVTAGDEIAADILSILAAQIADNGVATATVSGNHLALTVSTAGVNYTVTSDVLVHAAGADNSAADVVTTQENVEARAAVAQVDTVELGALAYNAGDVVHVNVGSQHYDYTVSTEMSASAVATAVAALVNANGGDASVTALANGTDISLTAKVAGVAFTSTASVDNVGLIDNVVTQSHTAANVVEVLAQAQETDIVVSGGVQLGNTYTLQVNDHLVEYVAQSGDTLADVLSSLQGELVDTGVAVRGTIVHQQDGSEVLQLTANVPGTQFTASLTETAHAAGVNANAVNIHESQANVTHADAVAQVSNVSLAGTFEAGDTYSVTVDGDGNLATTADQAVATYTVGAGESVADVLGALASQISLHSAVDGGVSAVYLDNGIIQLTGNANGQSFAVETATTNRVAGANDNIVTTTGVEGHAEVIGQAQVSELSFVNEHFVAGDTIDLLLNQTDFTYVVTGNEASNAEIAAALANKVNDVNDNFTAVSAAPQGVDPAVLVLTGTAQGIAFDAQVHVVHHDVAVA